VDKVTIVTGAAAPLIRPNIDTDTIIRIERLTQLTRQELGHYAFESLRYSAGGSENAEFVLNQTAFRDAPILLAGPNFGCGSSREGAVWALLGAGIRCVIASSFGEIFYNNCFQNGMLPVRLIEAQIAVLAQRSLAGHSVIVDLVAREVRCDDESYAFSIEPMRREALLHGQDAISVTLQYRREIRNWQMADAVARPWIWAVARM
jgi:3-isopropylmalate/(R)-2-methylmalate dehydratase small subunit